MSQFHTLAAEHFHAVGAETAHQTIAESRIDSSIDMGRFTIHHGERYGLPIVIVEHHDQQPSELSGIWVNEGAAQ